jgi:hypothetical protein
LNTKARSIRVDDEVWNNAKHVADLYNTNVSEMINAFLKRLVVHREPDHVAKTTANKVLGDERPKRPGPKHKIEVVRVDPDNCDHPVIRTIPYGNFCLGCGQRMP